MSPPCISPNTHSPLLPRTHNANFDKKKGERDYRNLPAGTPSWKGNIPVGHGGTLGDANGGKFGRAILNWAKWTLKGDQTAAQWFKNGYQADGWQVQSKDLDKLKPATK